MIKKLSGFFALFFLPGLFTLYYYFLVIKNKWLEKVKNNSLLDSQPTKDLVTIDSFKIGTKC